jgi:predicted MPP superfamily phosphohydrolase
MKTQLMMKILWIFLLYNLLIFFIGWNAWVWLSTSFQLDGVGYYTAILIGLSYSYLLGRKGPRLAIFRIIGSYWMAIVQYALLILPFADLSVVILYYFSSPIEALIFWAGIIVLSILASIFAYGTFNAYSPVVRTYKITIPKQAGTYRQLRIAMASDMHFGILSGKSHLQRLVRIVNTIKPDIVLFPGDIIDDEPGPFIQKNMREVMKQIKAPLGTYGILGNHEYFGKKIPEFLQEMKASNVNMLLDEVVLVEDSFYLVGRRDRTERNRKSLEELMNGLDNTLPIILMDHQPYHLDQAASNGIDVMVSGHTHRGQMAPNHLVTKRMYEIDWGYLQKNKLHVIVSSGFGFWGPPLRIGSRSEVIQIDIHFS